MKKYFFTILFLFAYTFMYPANSVFHTNQIIEKSIGLGNILAIVISWSKNKNILYAIIHGILGWFYVIYHAVSEGKKR